MRIYITSSILSPAARGRVQNPPPPAAPAAPAGPHFKILTY